MAAAIRKQLGVGVQKVHGHYGELKVIVDGDVVVDGGAAVILGIMPSTGTILEKVRQRLSKASASPISAES